MTREEKESCICTINTLRRLALNIHGVIDVVDDANCSKLIELLKQEPCEDCISRAEVMDNYNGVETPVGYRKVVDMEVIKNMRSVYLKAKVGHWITKDGKEQGYDIAGVKTWYIQIVCSECGFIKTAIEGHTGQYHYCPNCGAEMQEVEE